MDSVDLKPCLNDPEFSDITLEAEGKRMFCHKVVLAARCPHLRWVDGCVSFLRRVFATNKAVKILKLKLKHQVATGLVVYLYTGGVVIQREWLEELFVAAQVYELSELQAALEDQMGAEAIKSMKYAANFPGCDLQRGRPGQGLGRIETVSQFETEKMRVARKKIVTEIVETGDRLFGF